MIPSNTGFAGALDRAADRWKKAFLIVGEPDTPQPVTVADYHDAQQNVSARMPSPFRPYRE